MAFVQGPSGHESRELITKHEEQPFRFRDLPTEIRVMIYKIALVDVNEVKGSWKVRNPIHGPRDPKHSPASLLRVSKMIYKEAAPILYSQNLFRFRGHNVWPDFGWFLSRLTDISKNDLRMLEFDFSKFGKTHLGGFRMAYLALRRLPNIETMRFGIRQDLMTRDLEVFRKFSQFQLPGKVVLDFKGVLYRYYNQLFQRSVRVSSSLIAESESWGWSLVGSFKTIDNKHDERKWIAQLRNERKRNIRFSRK